MNYRITHSTEYKYSERISFSHNEARLIIRNSPDQSCANYRFTIEPEPTFFGEHTDFFGNLVAYFAIEKPHDAMEVKVVSDVFIDAAIPDIGRSMAWDDYRDWLTKTDTSDVLDARQFILNSPGISAAKDLLEYASPSFPPERPLLAAVNDLMYRIFTEFEFDSKFTTLATPLSEVLKHRKGVCQDFAHLAIGCLRSLKLPARYVSGYIETLPPEGRERLVGADASHAWFSVYEPGAGWVDFDPTNNIIPSGQHITVAWGRDYTDVTPLKGVLFGSGSHTLAVSVDVERRS